MAYIGNTVQNQGFAPAVDYFNGDGTTVTFTLSRPVASVAQLTAVIENVIQNPSTAFTVSGSSITFTSAPPSGTNNIWVEYTSLITTYAAISQDPTVIGDITATGGYSSTGDYGNSFVDGVIVDYVTGNARITTGTSDGITLYNGGTSARSALMTLTSAGNVGIGTTSPSYKLDIVGSAARISNAGTANFATRNSTAGVNWEWGVDGSGNGFVYTAQSSSLVFSNSTTERMRIDSSGNLLVGTTIAQSSVANRGNITVGGSAGAIVNWANASSRLGYIFHDGTNMQVNNNTNGYMNFYTNDTERMRIDSSGRVTMPYQPAFAACGAATSITTSGGSVMAFSTVLGVMTGGNRTSGYNTSTYRYTAPVAGLYSFSFIVFPYNGSGYTQWAPYKNGAIISTTDQLLVTSSYTDNYMANGTFFLELAVGDYVDMRPRSGYTGKWFGGHSLFMGYLIG